MEYSHWCGYLPFDIFQRYLPKFLFKFIVSKDKFKFIISARYAYICNEGLEDSWLFNTNPFISKKIKVHMRLHAAIMTTDQNFLWSTLAINHDIFFHISNKTSCDIQSSKVVLLGLLNHQHNQTYSSCMNIWVPLMASIHLLVQIIKNFILPPN